MKRLFEAFSPASKPPQTYLQYEDIEGAGKSGEDPSAGFVDAQPLPEYNYDAAPLVSATTDTDRIDRMRKESYRRLETSRAFFADLLRLQNPPSTIEEFVSSLEDGSYIVQLLQKITGMIERPKKLANLGPPGITAENFERITQMCAIAEIRVDAIVTLHDIQVKNVAKLALFFEDLQIAASRARANGILVGTPIGPSHTKSRRVVPPSPDACRAGKPPVGLAALLHSGTEEPASTANIKTARTLLSPQALAMPTSSASSFGSVLQGIANVEEKKSLVSEKTALEKRIASLTAELDEVKASKARLEETHAAFSQNLSRIAESLKVTEDRCSKKDDELQTMNAQLLAQTKLLEEERAQWKAALDDKSRKEATMREELKQHKIALQELKTRLEEWDAKKKMFDTLHEELATVNERNAALMIEAEETKSALAASEAKPPTVVTATVTVVKEVPVPTEDSVTAAARTHALINTRQSLATLKKNVDRMKVDVRSSFVEAAGQFTAFTRDFTECVVRMQSDAAQANERYLKELKERRRLHNLVAELKGNIRVFCRVRPANREELSSGDKIGITTMSQTELFVASITETDGASKSGKKPATTFEFDRVFGPASTQAEVFDEIKPMVASALDGYHACIFAYGQTGAGKSYTMSGPPSDRGVNFRTLHTLFEEAKERSSSFEYTFKVNMLEIYNENVLDLLTTSSSSLSSAASEDKSLEIRQGPHGLCVPDATTEDVSSIDDVERLMSRGEHNRTVGFTNCNEHSSRSHSLLLIDLFGVNKLTGARSRGRLVLVDLAGSERVSKSGVTGIRMKEAQSINKSLSALGNVIQALVAKQSHVPFRDSKLTFLLQDSLGKDNKTLMIVQVNPMLSCRGESVCSLNFAQRVQKVELGKAKSHSDADEVAKARTALSKARDELKAAQDEASEAIEKLQRAHQEDAATIESLKNQLTSSVTSSSAQLTAVQLEVKALISKLAASEAVNAALTSELQSLRSQPAQVITVPATVDTDALIADAVAKVKAEAEEEKKTAVHAAVETVKRAAQEQLSKKRQMRANERISIIGANVPSAIAVPPPVAPMPSIIPSITLTASSVGKAPTPFKPTVAAPTEDESDVEDEVQPAGKPRIPTKGTPAKGLAVESEDEGVSDGEHDEFEDTWTSGLDAFTGKLSFTSDGSVKPILKAAPVSRVESIRSIARSLSTIGLPPKTLAGPALITKQKKKVTFISPNNSTTLKREREDGVAQPAISEPAGVPIESETVTVDENSGPTVPKKAAFHTPRVPAKKIKIFGGAERVLASTPRRATTTPAAPAVGKPSSTRVPDASKSVAATAATGGWRM